MTWLVLLLGLGAWAAGSVLVACVIGRVLSLSTDSPGDAAGLDLSTRSL